MTDLKRRSLVAALGAAPFAAGVLFDGTNLWVVNNGDSTLMKLTPATGAVVTTYATGKGPFAVAFDGTKVWVPNFSSNSVSSTAAN